MAILWKYLNNCKKRKKTIVLFVSECIKYSSRYFFFLYLISWTHFFYFCFLCTHTILMCWYFQLVYFPPTEYKLQDLLFLNYYEMSYSLEKGWRINSQKKFNIFNKPFFFLLQVFTWCPNQLIGTFFLFTHEKYFSMNKITSW